TRISAKRAGRSSARWWRVNSSKRYPSWGRSSNHSPSGAVSHRDSAAPAARGHRPALERLVLDKTGLTGCYDFELDYGDADPGGRGGSGTADRAEIADSEGQGAWGIGDRSATTRGGRQ